MKSSGSSSDLRTENVTFTAQPVTSGQGNTVTLTCNTLTEIVGIAAITQQSCIDFRNGIKACSFNGNQATIGYYLFATASAKDVTITFIGTTTTPVPDIELLWTNPNPTSAFAAQTVSLDLSNYKSVCIEYVQNSTSSAKCYPKAFYAVGDTVSVPASNATQQAYIGGAYGRSGASYSTARVLSITTTGIVFGTGYAQTGAGSGYGVPQRIWGIKAQIYPSST